MQVPHVQVVVAGITIWALFAGGIACGRGPLGVSDDQLQATDESARSFASEVLPGKWTAVGFPLEILFDDAGHLLEIINTADPDDWKTNVKIGESRRIDNLFWSAAVVFEAGESLIEPVTGEARFEMNGIATDLVVRGTPVPGEGSVTIRFVGTYAFESDEFHGSLFVVISFGPKEIYSEEQALTLRH